MSYKIALSAGHRNTNRGGNPCELADDRTGHVTAAVARELRRYGFDVQVVQPNDGLGFYAGSLSAVGRQVVTWARQGWSADLFLEFHFEGNRAGDRARGSFLIYPDQGGELDRAAKDRLEPLLTAAMQRHTGIPPRGDGDMAESETNVKQLGVLRALATLKATLTRALFEVANCEAPSDRAIMARPDFIPRTAQAIAEGVAQFFDVPIPGTGKVVASLPSGAAQPLAEPLPPGVRRYVVGPRGAIVRTAKTAASDEVRRLEPGAIVNIQALVFDLNVDNRQWYWTADQAGFIEASALRAV